MRTGTVLIAIAVVGFADSPARAANSVRVESRTVTIGDDSISLGVFIENDISLFSCYLPLEIREVSGGAYFDGIFTFDLNPFGRVITHPLCSFPYLIKYYLQPDTLSTCSGPVSLTWIEPLYDTSAYGSPDAVMWLYFPCGSIVTPPGSDGETASLQFVFDVNTSVGSFEIDTCCISPANHLYFVDELSQVVVPEFTKGIVTIACDCSGRGDVYGDDGVIDVMDLIELVEHVFKSGPALPADPFCPEYANRGDVDCSGFMTVLDVVHVVNVAFRGADPATEFCDPCAP